MIFTNLAPNTEKTDAVLALRLLLAPEKNEKPVVADLEEKIAALTGTTFAITFESGRTALHAILTAAGIGRGDEVLLQAYTCVAVPDPVIWAGATPIYVDCDETLTLSLDDLRKKVTPQTKAIIIQHTFGVPARLTELLAFAKEHNLFVIEDCAHALGAVYQGKPVGSFGDAAFVSFGRDKVISSVFGGAAVTTSSALAGQLDKIRLSYPAPTASWVRQQLAHPVIMWFGKKTYSYGGKILIALAKRLHFTSRAVYPEERRGGKPSFTGKRLSGSLARLALAQLAKIERFNAHRRSLAALYEKKLLPFISAEIFSVQSALADTNPLWLRYTLWGRGATVIRDAAAKQGLLLGDWYDTVIAPRGTDLNAIGYTTGSCPNAETIAATTLNLPTDIVTTEADAERICSFIHELLSTR